MIRVDRNGEATLDTNYRDTVYDALAASNRTARANFQAIKRLETVILFALIIVGILLIRGKI